MANINQMIADLDQQISSLQTARQALAEAHGVGAAPHMAGPRRTNQVGGYRTAGARPKRTMSPEAIEKIRAAQKLRWSKVAKGKTAAKKVKTKWPVVPVKKAASPSNRRPRSKKEAPHAETVQTPVEETVS